jgi:hypothetical protein
MKKKAAILYSAAFAISSFSVAVLSILSPLIILVERRVFARISFTRLALLLILLLEVLIKLYVIIFLEPWSPQVLLRELALPVIYISFLSVSIREGSQKLMCRVAIMLFLADLSVNILTFALGSDVFGREVPQRIADLSPRFIGIFGHPFASINASIIGFVSGLTLRQPLISALALLSLLCTGSQRGPVMAFLLVLAVFLVRRRLPPIASAFCSYGFAVVVISLTFYAASSDADLAYAAPTGNQLRALLWLHSASILPSGFIFGVRGLTEFEYNPDVGVDFEGLSTAGVAESFLLQSFIDYGFFAFALKALFLLVVMTRLLLAYRRSPSSASLAPSVLALIYVSESIFGTSVSSSVYVGLFYGALCLADRRLF